MKTRVEQVVRQSVLYWYEEVNGDELVYSLEGIQKEEEKVDQTG